MNKEELYKLGLAERYAHRGYYKKPEIPENSLPAFRRAIEYGLGSEFDVHLIKDGSLVIFHDEYLNRMTGAPGEIEDYTLPELKKLRLGNTDETIPTFDELLDLYEGTGLPLMVELKPNRGNHRKLAEAVAKRLDSYKGPFAVESFDPRAVYDMRKLRPEWTRGQLAQDYFRKPEGLPLHLIVALTFCVFNVFTKPKFIAYKYEHRNNKAMQRMVAGKDRLEVLWTIGTKRGYDETMKKGIVPIFEKIEPEEIGLVKTDSKAEK